jgi:hypothetical protein
VWCGVKGSAEQRAWQDVLPVEMFFLDAKEQDFQLKTEKLVPLVFY